ncbi:MAG: sugar phosphate nucleotidyltransferase, partial [Candidatus Thorarchaeota archaeon]
MNITKGVVYAAEWNYDFLPYSKSIPFEMIPFIDKPLIELIIRELLDSNIEEILIITNKHKKILEDYFDKEIELENIIEKEKNNQKLNKILEMSDLHNIHYVHQKNSTNSVHILELSKRFINKNAFALVYPRSLFFTDTPPIKQMLDHYEETGKSIIGVAKENSQNNLKPDLHCEINNDLLHFTPNAANKKTISENQKYINGNRYIFTPDILNYVDGIFHNPNSVEQLLMSKASILIEKRQILAKIIEGDHLVLA